MVGGVLHNVGQLAVASLLMETDLLLYYLPFLLVFGVVAGIVIGLLAGVMVRRIRLEV